MKWTMPWIEKQPNKTFQIDETVIFPKAVYQHVDMLDELKQVHIYGKASYDSRNERVDFDLCVEADMILKCSISLEPIEYPVKFDQHLTFGYHEDEQMDVYLIRKEQIDLMPIIVQLVLMEIPIRVVKHDIDMKMQGDGWEVVNQQPEYQEPIDPRFAKLSKLLKEKEEE